MVGVLTNINVNVKRVKTNNMKEIYKSLANFQQEVPVIHEATKGYGYTYSDLKTILKVINPLLKKHGLTFCQTFDDDTLITA